MRTLLKSDKALAPYGVEKEAYTQDFDTESGKGLGRQQAECLGLEGVFWGGLQARESVCVGGKGPTRGQGKDRAYRKHVVHVCDAGRVEAQRLVELRCSLMSQKGLQTKRVRRGPQGRREGMCADEQRKQSSSRQGPTHVCVQAKHALSAR